MPLPRLFATMDTRRFLRLLGVIAGVGLVLRLIVCMELSGTTGVANPVSASDMATYKRLALEILDGKWPEAFYYQPFYYAVYLPFVYLVTLKSVWGLLLVQTLLGGATVWLTGLTTARVFGRRAGLVAAALLALARFPIFYTPFLLMATLQAFWLSLLAYLLVMAWHRPVWWRWLSVALVTSVATLTRGNVLLFVPGLLAVLAWRHRRKPVLAIGMAVAFVAVVYLPQLPFAIRNYHHYGRWTGPSSAMDAVLALGNTPEAPPGGLEYPPSYGEAMRLASLPNGERVPVLTQMRQWALAEPMQFLELKLRTFLLFWNRQEVPNNVSIGYHGAKSMLLKIPLLFGFALIGTLGVFGMFVSWRWRSPSRLYLYFAVLMYCAGTVLFYILARFRVPIVPLVCVFAGNGVVLGYERLRTAVGEAGRQRRLLIALGVVCAAFLVCGAFQLYQMRCEAAAMRVVRPNGVRVDLPDRVIHQDHGPLGGIGGVAPQELPPNGTLIGKLFVGIKETTATAAILRVPILRTPDTEMEFQLQHCEMRDDPSVPKWEKDSRGFEWMSIPITLGSIQNGKAQVAIGLHAKQGQAGVLFDQYRKYGRTRVRTPSGEIETFEAALELVIPKQSGE